MKDGEVQSEYDRILEYALAHFPKETHLISQSTEWQKVSYRKMFQNVLDRIPVPLAGKVIVDFGCKYGHLVPLLFESGARKVIGVEALDQFILIARELFSAHGSRLEFLKSEDGYIPLQPETVDIIIMNEVISHVNPMFLPITYAEVARILVTGGSLFISDGNNLAFPGRKEVLDKLHHAIEYGPEGTQLDNGAVVQSSLLNQRKSIIRSRISGIKEDKIDFLAKNTSGLFGDYLNQAIDRFAQTGELVCRPHRPGNAPTYPDSGEVEERGFYPEQVVFELTEVGFECRILDKPCRPPGARIRLDNLKIQHATGYGGYAYQIPIPTEYPIDKKCPTLVLENDQPLPIGNIASVEIAKKGKGRYCVWVPNRTVYLSSLDNSDPRTNGHKYEFYWTTDSAEMLTYGAPGFQIVATKKP